MGKEPKRCSNEAEHEPEPEGYLEWHAWAAKKSRTHYQKRCPMCTLYKIWVPRKKTVRAMIEQFRAHL